MSRSKKNKKKAKTIVIIISTIIIIGLIIVTIIGIGNSNSNSNSNGGGGRNHKKSDNLDAIGSYKYGSTIECEAFEKNIKYAESNYMPFYRYYSNFIVTEDNEVYVFDYNKKFSSTDTNCVKLNEKVDIIHKEYVTKEMNGGISPVFYLDKDMNYLEINSDTQTITKTQAIQHKYLNPLYHLLHDNGYIYYHAYNLSGYEDIVYAINGDNNIYQLEADLYDEYMSLLDEQERKLINKKIVYSVPEDEKIIEFRYVTSGSDYDDNFILTDKSYYRTMLINKEECLEYSDVECIYELKKDEEVSKYIDNFILISEDTLITRSGRVYYYSTN